MSNTQLRQILRRYPKLRGPLRKAFRSWQYNSARLLGKMRQDKLDLIEVDPKRIKQTVNHSDPSLTGNGVWHLGTVQAGDWDLDGVPVKEYDQVYQILAAHLQQRKPFAEIPEFQEKCAAIEQGQLVDSSTTPAEYLARWQNITALYEDIKKNGYKTQVELASDNPLDEIRVQIGRHGEILFEEGLHRLAIALNLGLPAVPVLITRRHSDWAALRTAVMKIVIQRGFIHQPFDHPDLDSLPLIYGNDLAEQAWYGHDRWQLISDSLPVTNGTVLDIGAYFGYFDHRLEGLGFDCIAVEPDPENLDVLNLYRTMNERKFTVWATSIFEIKRFEFDIVLALNIFHHLVRTKRDYTCLVDFLHHLRCRALYFEPDNNAGVKAYRQFNDNEFVEFVQEHTGLTESHFLGQTKEGRPLYLLM